MPNDTQTPAKHLERLLTITYTPENQSERLPITTESPSKEYSQGTNLALKQEIIEINKYLNLVKEKVHSFQ
mgnify:FL=1